MGNVKKLLNKEMLFYITVSIGMAVSTTSFAIVSGVFSTLTSFWAIMSVAASAILCLLIARPIAELAGIFPAAPGIRTYLIQGFGNQTSLVFVFMYILFMIMIGSVENYMFASVVQTIFPDFPAIYIVLLVILFIVVINTYGLELPRTMQIISVLILVSLIFGIGLTGIIQSDSLVSSLKTSVSQENAGLLFPASIGFSLFLFVGFEWVTPLGFNAAAYERKIPLAMPVAIGINAIMYLIFFTGISGHFTNEVIAGTDVPQSMLAARLFGYTGLWLALGLSLLGIISTFNAGIMGGARLIYGIAREGYLPQKLARISLKRGTPVNAILSLGISVFISSAFLLWLGLELLFAVIGSGIICFVYGMLIWSLLKIRKKHKKKKVRYASGLPRWFMWLLITLLFVFGIGSLMSIEEVQENALIGLPAVALIAFAGSSWMIRRKKKNQELKKG